jgi:hypothetical protein
VHAALVLDEEVFAVEVVDEEGGLLMLVVCVKGGRGRASSRLAVVEAASARVAAVEAWLNVLGADVTLPFVLRRERACAAVAGKCAHEAAF